MVGFCTTQQRGTLCSQMLSNTGVYQEWKWVFLQDQPSSEESLCSNNTSTPLLSLQRLNTGDNILGVRRGFQVR